MNIQLTDGRLVQFDTESSVNLKNEGTYGNGSIDWSCDGLRLSDIATRVGIENALAVLVDGKLTAITEFVNSDCELQYVKKDDEIGKAMINHTVLFLVAYGIKSLSKEVKRVDWSESSELIFYDFLLSEEKVFTIEELKLAEQYIYDVVLANTPIKSLLVPYYLARKILLEQDEIYLLEYIDSYDDYGPIKLQTVDKFIELNHGLLLSDLSVIKSLNLSQKQIGDKCRITATVEIQ